jgi:hypothetical protein
VGGSGMRSRCFAAVAKGWHMSVDQHASSTNSNLLITSVGGLSHMVQR